MTGRILTVASSKGGGGKTCLVCCLAPNLAALGYKVGVIDADPNASFATWHEAYRGPEIRCRAEARDVPVVDLAQEWADELDVVIIDTAGFGNLTAAAAMGAADHVLVPCMPDRGSTREAHKTIQKAASLARAARRAITASVVLSQWRTGGVAETAALEDLADYGIASILRVPLPDRAAFRRMSFDSKGIISGPIGSTVDRMIAELVGMGVLEEPIGPAEKAAAASLSGSATLAGISELSQ
jgi:chromosome partitioning protein